MFFRWILFLNVDKRPVGTFCILLLCNDPNEWHASPLTVFLFPFLPKSCILLSLIKATVLIASLLCPDGPGQLPWDIGGDWAEEGRRNASLQGASQWEGLQQENHEALQDASQSATGQRKLCCIARSLPGEGGVSRPPPPSPLPHTGSSIHVNTLCCEVVQLLAFCFASSQQEYTVDQQRTQWFSLYHSLQHYKYHTYLMCKDEVRHRFVCTVCSVAAYRVF